MTASLFLRLLTGWLFLTLLAPQPLRAESLTFSTVERPPFSMSAETKQANSRRGFSIDLMDALARQTGHTVTYLPMGSFAEMLGAVQDGRVDGAIANISITAAREEVLDFSLPIYQSGLQLMVEGAPPPPPWRQIFSREIFIYILLAIGMLFGFGMLMWVFERHRQPYFERSASEVMFPAFWWALNLLVNGGFEERQPRSLPGRILATLMVFSSLFVVGLFVARITAVMTVTALTSTVTGINDLDQRSVGTVSGSTAAEFLDLRSVEYIGYAGFAEVIAEFEAGRLDVVMFDAPLLQYYLSQESGSDAYLVDRVFRSEDYGIALPTGSPLREELNRALLVLRESGEYTAIERKWFGDGK
jgi:ABC-type amino acid transport substrate-binding protein